MLLQQESHDFMPHEARLGVPCGTREEEEIHYVHTAS